MSRFFWPVVASPPKTKEPEFAKRDTFFTNIKKISQVEGVPPITPMMKDNGEYNILELYTKVIERLDSQKSNNLDTSDQIEIQKWIAENDPDPTERRMAQEKLFEISNNKCQKSLREEFMKKADVLLEIYKDLCRIPIVIEFDKRVIVVDKSVQLKKKKTAEEFITLCQEYVPINLTIKLEKYVICCENASTVCEDGTFYCSSCGEIAKTLDQVGAYKDQKRVSANNRQRYYNVKHFEATVKKVQGIHKKEIPPFVFEELDRFRGIRNKKIEDFSIYDLYHVLKMNGELSGYYKDIHLIYRLYTGVQVINLSDVEDRLKEMYCEQDKLSETFKTKDDAKNSINATYMCCRLAQFAGRTDLRIKDFFCTKTEETVKKYDRVMEQRARSLGWLLQGEEFHDVCK